MIQCWITIRIEGSDFCLLFKIWMFCFVLQWSSWSRQMCLSIRSTSSLLLSFEPTATDTGSLNQRLTGQLSPPPSLSVSLLTFTEEIWWCPFQLNIDWVGLCWQLLPGALVEEGLRWGVLSHSAPGQCLPGEHAQPVRTQGKFEI